MDRPTISRKEKPSLGVEVRRLKPEELGPVLEIYRASEVKRHLIPDTEGKTNTPEEEETEMARWTNEDAVYGIFHNGKLAGMGFLYPYEDRNMRQMVKKGLVPDELVPKAHGKITDYSRVFEASLLVPSTTTIEVAAEGLRQSVEAYKQDYDLKSAQSLSIFYRLQKEEDSIGFLETGVKHDQLFQEELDKEGRILTSAGFNKTGNIEKGGVGVFVLGS